MCWAFLICCCAWLLSPPYCGLPQVTTAPDSRMAAKAESVAWMCWTPGCCLPHNLHAHGHNSPRFTNSSKSTLSCLDVLDVPDVPQLPLHLAAVSAPACITPGNFAPGAMPSEGLGGGSQFPHPRLATRPHSACASNRAAGHSQ